MNEEAIRGLTSLGLSNAQAKTFLTLSVLKSSEASPLAEKAGVPQPKIYGYLDDLEKLGIIYKHVIEGKPNQYEAIDYNQAIAKLKSNLDSQLEAGRQYIQRERDKLDIKPEKQFVKVIQGEHMFETGLKELLQSAEKNIIYIGHNMYEDLFSEMKEDLQVPLLNIMDYDEYIDPNLMQTLASNFSDIFKKRRSMLLVTDLNTEEKMSSSVNIVVYPKEELNLEPLIIRILHPSIIRIQVGILLGFAEQFGISLPFQN